MTTNIKSERSWALVRLFSCGLFDICIAKYPTIGEPHEVRLAWDKVLDREETKGDIVGFYHTHPNSSGNFYSEKDRVTMTDWCSCFGKLLYCVIKSKTATKTFHFNKEGHQETTAAFKIGSLVFVESR